MTQTVLDSVMAQVQGGEPSAQGTPNPKPKPKTVLDSVMDAVGRPEPSLLQSAVRGWVGAVGGATEFIGRQGEAAIQALPIPDSRTRLAKKKAREAAAEPGQFLTEFAGQMPAPTKWPGRVAEAAGGVAPYVLAEAATGGAATLPVLGLIGGQHLQGTYDEALRATGDPTKATTAMLLNIPGAAAMAVPFGRVFGRLVGKPVGGIIRQAIEGSVTGALGLGSAGILGDVVHEQITGEDRAILKNAMEGVSADAPLFAFLGAAAGVRGEALRARGRQVEADDVFRSERVGARTEPVVRKPAEVGPETMADLETFAGEQRKAKPGEGLPAALGEAEGLRAVEPTTPAERMVSELGARSGVPVTFVERSAGGRLPLAGRRTATGILIDANAPSELQIKQVAFEELIHTVAGRDPAAYQKLHADLTALDPEGMALAEKRALDEHAAAGVPYEEQTALAQEEGVGRYAQTIAGYLDMRLAEPEKLARLFEQKPGLARRFVEWIQGLLQKAGLLDARTSGRLNRIARQIALTPEEMAVPADKARAAADVIAEAYGRLVASSEQRTVEEPGRPPERTPAPTEQAAAPAATQPGAASAAPPTKSVDVAAASSEPPAPSPSPSGAERVRALEDWRTASRAVEREAARMETAQAEKPKRARLIGRNVARLTRTREGAALRAPKAVGDVVRYEAPSGLWWDGIVREVSGSRVRIEASRDTGRVSKSGAPIMDTQTFTLDAGEVQLERVREPGTLGRAEQQRADIPDSGEARFAVARPDPLGFRSTLEDAAEEKLPERGAALQFLKTLENTPGVKLEEVEWSGIRDFLKGKLVVTKAEVQEYLRGQNVRVEERELGSDADSPRIAALRAEMVELSQDRDPVTNVMRDERRWHDLASEREKLIERQRVAQTKFSQYQLPGGTNYRELLLTLPTKGAEDATALRRAAGEARAARDSARSAVSEASAPLQALGQGEGLSQLDLANISLDENTGASRRVREGNLGSPEFKRAAEAYWTKLGTLQRRSDELISAKQAENVPAQAFTAGHFSDTPNVLAHLRVNDRTTADGKRMLFIEEVQSDWHQKGRKKGYVGEQYAKAAPSGAQAMVEAGAVPDAPFKKTWHELALKRAIRYAAENGYDSVGWTTGEQQIDRYIQSVKQLREVTYHAETNKLTGTTTDGRNISETVPAAKLPDYIGKEPAARLLAKDQDSQGNRSVTGEEMGAAIRAGGEHFRLRYDTQLPAAANKIGKVGGAVVEDANIGVPAAGHEKVRVWQEHGGGDWVVETHDGNEWNEVAWADNKPDAEMQALEWEAPDTKAVYSLPITPALRDVAMQRGFSRFAVARAPDGTQGFDVPEETKAEHFYRLMVNDLEPIVRAEKAAPNKLQAPGGETLETALSRLPGGVYKHGEKIREQFVTPLKAKMQAAGVSREDAESALLDLSAPKANETLAQRHPRKFGQELSPGSGIRTAEAQARTAKRLAGPQAEFYRWLQDWNRSLNKHRLDLLEQMQLITPEQRKGWTDAWGEDYVPYRTLEPDAQVVFGSKGLGVSGAESKRREGRTSRPDSPIAFSLSTALQAADRGERNRIGNLMGDIVRRNPGESWGVVEDRGRAPETATVLSFKEGGEQRWVWTSDKPLGEAFQRMQAEPGFVKVLDPTLRFLRRSITQYDPTFPLRNMPKDMTVATIRHAIHGDWRSAAATLKGGIPAARGAVQEIRSPGSGGEWGTWYRKALDAHALIGWNESFDVESRIKELDRVTDPETRTRKALTFMSDLNKATELGTRIAGFRSMVESGMSVPQAAMKTRRITVDFARKGKWTPVLNRLYLFSGANIQGTAEMMGSIKRNPARAAAVLGAYMGTGLLTYAASRIFGDEDELRKLSEYDKARFFGVMVGKHRIGVMAPYGFNFVPYLGWKLGEEMMGEGDKNLVAHATTQIIDALNPLPSAPNLTLALTPTVGRPFAEIGQNQDFAGRPIAPPEDPYARVQKPAHLRKFKGVSQVADIAATWLSKVGIEVSPEWIEHLGKAMVPGSGATAGRLQDTMLRTLTGETDGRFLSDFPPTRPFVQQPSRGAEARLFYENLTAVAQAEQDKELGKDFDEAVYRLKAYVSMMERRIKALKKREGTEAQVEEVMARMNKRFRETAAAVR